MKKQLLLIIISCLITPSLFAGKLTIVDTEGKDPIRDQEIASVGVYPNQVTIQPVELAGMECIIPKKIAIDQGMTIGEVAILVNGGAEVICVYESTKKYDNKIPHALSFQVHRKFKDYKN